MAQATKSAAAWEAWRWQGSSRYVTAPIVDGSELAFRELCPRHGVTLAYTLMLNSRVFVRDAKYRREHLTKKPHISAAFRCTTPPQLKITAKGSVRPPSTHREHQQLHGVNFNSENMAQATKSAAAWEAWRRLGSPRYVTAPMVDGSELAFRELCRRYGVTLAYTPMLNSRVFVRDAKYRREHFTTNLADRPLAAQFCANDPKLFVEAARHVQADVDAIDLNLGCPQDIARRGNYGSFLQDEWDLLRDIVSTAARELDVPIWCKIRIFPSLQRTVAYAKMLEDAGASLIAVHGRTREQKGREVPPADWDAIRAVKRAVGIPVIANGNVRCLADADMAIAATEAEAVMSAWALLDNPATFHQGPSAAPSRLELAREYLELAEKFDTPMRMVRLHMFKMFRSRLDVNVDLNGDVARCRTISEFREVTDKLAERCDFDGISFESRVLSGDVPTNVISEKKAKRMKLAEEKRNAGTAGKGKFKLSL